MHDTEMTDGDQHAHHDTDMIDDDQHTHDAEIIDYMTCAQQIICRHLNLLRKEGRIHQLLST